MTPGEHTVGVNIMDSDTAGNLPIHQIPYNSNQSYERKSLRPMNQPATAGIGDQAFLNRQQIGWRQHCPDSREDLRCHIPGGKTGAAEINWAVLAIVVQVTNYALSCRCCCLCHDLLGRLGHFSIPTAQKNFVMAKRL